MSDRRQADRRFPADRRMVSDRRAVDEEPLRLLCDVYHRLWAEAYYDPFNELLREFAKPLCDKMEQANAKLRFRR